MRVVVSELSGRQNVQLRAGAMGLAAGADVLQQVKTLEHVGHQFEAADGSFEMLVRRSAPDYRPPFELLGFTVIVEGRSGGETSGQAMVQLRVDGEVIHTAAEGAGPVNALDNAVRKALLPRYPELADVHLVDYKVRIVDEHLGRFLAWVESGQAGGTFRRRRAARGAHALLDQPDQGAVDPFDIGAQAVELALTHTASAAGASSRTHVGPSRPFRAWTSGSAL